MGIEIMSELPDADMIIMPVGGGGLAAGVGTYIKTLRPQVALIGVEPEGAPSMRDALLAGEQTSPICISNCSFDFYCRQQCHSATTAYIQWPRVVLAAIFPVFPTSMSRLLLPDAHHHRRGPRYAVDNRPFC